MDNIKGVVTGDIIKSTDIQIEHRDLLLSTIKEAVKQWSPTNPLKIDFFRGDSFQMVIEHPEDTIKVAIFLRAALKAHTPKDSKNDWDARLSIGIGSVSYAADSIVVSDGEAFQYSGRELDDMGKRCLNVKTPWSAVNAELKVSTSFADDIITSWTKHQAEIVSQALLSNIAQKELAKKIGKSAQSVNKALTAARYPLIQLYIERCNNVIANHLIAL